MTDPNPRGGACAPSKGRSPGSLLFSAPFPGRKTSQWVRPILPSLQWRVRAGLAPDFPNTFRGCVVCPITIRQKTGMSNGLRPSAALRTKHSSRRAAAPLLGEERFGIIRLEFTPRVHPKSQGEMTEMGEPFRVSDLLDTLIRLEERGSAFYGDLAARTKSERARKL